MRHFTWLLRIIIVATGVVATIFLGKTLYFHSWNKAVSSLHGDELTLEPRAVDLGEVDASSEKFVKFRITNISNHAVKLLDARKSCSCTKVNVAFPIEIGPREGLDLGFSVNIPVESKSFSEGVVLYTNSATNPNFDLRVTARVRTHSIGPEKTSVEVRN